MSMLIKFYLTFTERIEVKLLFTIVNDLSAHTRIAWISL